MDNGDREEVTSAAAPKHVPADEGELEDALDDELRQQLVFRLALLGSDADESLEAYARHADRSAVQRTLGLGEVGGRHCG